MSSVSCPDGKIYGFEGQHKECPDQLGPVDPGAGPRGCDDALRQLCEKKMNGTFNSDDFYGPSCKVGDDKRDLCSN